MVARDLRPFFFSEEPQAPFRALQVRGFLFFIFVFYKNIFLFSKFTGIHSGRPAAGTWSPRCGAARVFL